MLVSDSASSRRSDLGSNDEASFGARPSSGDGFTTRGFTILDPEKGFGDPSMKDSDSSSSEFRSRQADHTDGERGISDSRLWGKMACGPETGGSARRDGPRSNMLTFRCAPWKQVRTFEGILGVFQDAHFSKTVSIFEQGAHLRRKRVSCSAPCLKSASCLCFLNLQLIFLDDTRARLGCQSASSAKSADDVAFAAIRAQSERTRLTKQKKPCLELDPGTAPLMRDLQLIAVPYFLDS
jgi:hypothetical protein